jgi:phospholipid-binding lipoprotein MlaA
LGGDCRTFGIIVLALAFGLGGAPAARAQVETPDLQERQIGAAPDPLFDDDFELDGQDASFPDPVEDVNRVMLRFNRAADRWVFDPITEAYRWLVPDPARRCVRRAFLNAGSPSIFVNDLLQLEWKDAGVTVSRLIVNSTVGIGGLFDPSQGFGLERHESDFGQTLSLAGFRSGPYLVLPLFGPSTARDGAGDVVDTFLSPTTYVFGSALTQQLLFGGGAGLSTRDFHYESLKALEESSIDFYATLRSAFYQNRVSEIWSRREHRRDDWVTDPIY